MATGLSRNISVMFFVFMAICNEPFRLGMVHTVFTYITNINGKAVPFQAWTGTEGYRRLRLPYFKTIGTGRW